MDREQITKESFMANMVKAFKKPEGDNQSDKNPNSKGKVKRRSKSVSFLSLISAGFGKNRNKKKYIFTESETQTEENGNISRATQTKNLRDNFTKDGKMRDLNIYENANLRPPIIQDGIA